MTRHARNCTAGSVYTYHEKKKDSSTSKYGSEKLRLGKDSIKDFDSCSLTLQPCREPVVTAEGHLYDKEVILEYILHKKIEIARQLKEFEKQKDKHRMEETHKRSAEHEKKVKSFVEKERSIVSKPLNPFKKPETEPAASSSSATSSVGQSISNMKEGKSKQLPAFWFPNQTPSAAATELRKPDEKVRCPMSGKPIRLKDLVPIKFTQISDGEKKALIVKDARYVCPVTNDVLGNSVPCAALRTSGSVVTMECIEKLIRKDMLDPINGKPLREKDIIPLQRGSTSFSAVGIKLEAKKDGAAMQA